MHHPHLVGAPGVDRLTGEEDLPCEGRADDLDELLAEREGHDEADPGQRHREARHVGGDAEITVQRQLAPTRVGRAVDHRDRRMA